MALTFAEQSLGSHPRCRLARFPTPIHRLQDRGLWVSAEHEIWIKRDDESSCILTGTKVRKLEFLIGEAVEQGARAVLTCGGYNSNHCRATALACASIGLECHLVLRLPPRGASHALSGNLALVELAGATVHWIDPRDYSQRDAIMRSIAADIECCYVVPEGGSSSVGVLGCAAAALEMLDQGKSEGFEPEYIVHAISSGGTTAGLVAGCSARDARVKILAVDVSGEPEMYSRRVRTLLHSVGWSGGTASFEVISGFAGGGYALPTPEALAVARRTARAEGLILDMTYTAKAFWGMGEMMSSGRIPEGSRVLFWHTGGVFGRYSGVAEEAGAEGRE